MSPCCVADTVPSAGDSVVNEMGRALPWLWLPLAIKLWGDRHIGNKLEVRGEEALGRLLRGLGFVLQEAPEGHCDF